METVRVSEYLDSRPGKTAQETAIYNLAYGTRILAQDDSWDKLASFQQPGSLPAGDSWLERARDANLLVTAGDPAPDFIVRLLQSLRTYLVRRGHTPTEGTPLELLAQAEKVFRERDMPRPYEGDPSRVGPLMRRPERMVDFVFDHNRAFMTHDLNHDEGGVDIEMVRQFSDRPAMKLRYEQQYCTPRTTQKRADMMRAALPNGGRVLVLGDDDLVSLALLKRGEDLQVDVLELDADLVAFLKEQGGERLTVLEHNLRHGVPDSMKDAYDLVTTDPPYAAAGMRFFLDCALASLAKKAESRLFLTTFPGLIENPDKLWSDLDELGLKIEKQHDHFSRYIYNNNYRVEHLASMRHLGCPLHPTSELLGFPFLYAHFFECRLASGL